MDTIEGLPDETVEEADRASRRWRSVWRMHFYAGIISAPILVMLAVTGLVILYTQPINDLVDADVRLVDVGGQARSYDDQTAAVTTAFPDEQIVSVVTPVDERHATIFGLADGRDAFVDPYTAEVLGTRNPDGGIVGLANRLHGFLNNDSIKVPVPTAAGLFGTDPLFTDVDAGDLLVEVVACWGLALAVSGIYLWWPRKRDTGKALFVPRLSATGRRRWRDLHAIPGILLSGIIIFFVVTGLPWSGFWGSNFSYAAEELTPGSYPDQPASSVARLGDIDRFGNKINWVLQDIEVPASEAPSSGGGHEGHSGAGSTDGESLAAGDPRPATLSLDSVIRSAQAEGMRPGFAVSLPEDVEADDGATTFGTHAASNPWPSRSQHARSVYLDQFTGESLGSQDLYGFGTVWKIADYGISTHMGTQFGLINRIVMTGAALGVIWLVISAFVMYLKRRRPGGAGLPRRPRDVTMANRLILVAIALAIVFPLWGASLRAVLAIDRFVIRRFTPLRAVFGQR